MGLTFSGAYFFYTNLTYKNRVVNAIITSKKYSQEKRRLDYRLFNGFIYQK